MSTTTDIGHSRRARLKRAISALPGGRAVGVRALIYHRVGGGSPRRARPPRRSVRDAARRPGRPARSSSLDDAVDRARRRRQSRRRWCSPSTTASRDVYDHAWPLLREREPAVHALPRHRVRRRHDALGRLDRAEPAGPALTWAQLARDGRQRAVHASATTPTRHVPPEQLTADELDRCTDDVERELGVVPRHFAYTLGHPGAADGARAARPVPSAPRPASSAATCPAPTRCGCAGSRSAAPTRSSSSAPSSRATCCRSGPTARWSRSAKRVGRPWLTPVRTRLRGPGGRPLPRRPPDHRRHEPGAAARAPSCGRRRERPRRRTASQRPGRTSSGSRRSASRTCRSTR